MASDSIIKLTAYQRRWMDDNSRFKMAMWSRQSGKSFALSLEAVDDSYAQPHNLWVLLSAGERQSKELMAKCAMHARAYGMVAEVLTDSFRAADNEYKLLEIKLANGSRIVGLPANPDTARGWSANILLDEFAIHKDSRAIWASMFPTLTRGYKLRIASTPKGRQNKFYELWTGNPRYSKHKLTIYDAVAQGLVLRDENGRPCAPEDLREALGDEEAWQQEYLCEFVDEATAYLTYEMIAECEDVKIDLTEPPVYEGGPVYAGVDVGRKRDLTVFWVCEDVGGVLWTREVTVMERAPFSSQREVMFGRIADIEPRRVCFDASGLGMQLAEEAGERFGSVAEGVTFTGPAKEDLAVTVKRRFEDKRIRIPVDPKIREDLHSVKRHVTAAGNVRFDAERTEDGHADRFWALALAAHAASGAAGPVEYESVMKLDSSLFDENPKEDWL